MKALFIGCHADDIELGCGATISKYWQAWEIRTVILSVVNPQGIDQTSIVELNLPGPACYQIPTRQFEAHRQDIWEILHEVETDYRPDLVFTQSQDQHRDHRVLFDVSMNLFAGSIYEYRPTAAFNHAYPFQPNHFECVWNGQVRHKMDMLSRYTHYRNKPYMQKQYIEARMAAEGGNCNTEFAEAFRVCKQVNFQ